MTRNLETTMASSAAKIGNIGKTLLAGFGFGAILGGLTSLPAAVRGVVRSLGDLADAADKIGLPVEELEAFRYGAQLAGVEADSLDDSLAKFTKTIGEASAKGNDFSKILDQNGVALKNADGSIRPVTELLSDYADLIKNASSETEQMFLATTAFGRGGGDMVNFLRDGADGLDKVRAAAKAAGVVLSDDLVRAAAEVDDSFDKLAMQMDSLFKTEVVQGIKTVQNLIEKFEALPGAIDGAWKSFEGFWNNIIGKSPQDIATEKLRAAINAAAVNGPPTGGFSVGDLDFGPAAPKSDRVGAPQQKTIVSIPGAVEDLTGAVDRFVDHVIKAESGGNNSAKNPNSSATGAGQFIESTWLDLFKRYFPDRAEGMTRGAILALRKDGNVSRSLIEAYASENARVLQAAGVHVDEAALQLAHFLGAGDAAKVLTAASGTPLAGLISAASIKANPTILGGGATVNDAISYAKNRASGGGSGRSRQKMTPEGVFAGSVQDIQQRIDLLNAEFAAQSQLNPAIDDYGFAVEKASIKQQLLNEAAAAGVAITPELSAKIDALASNYAKASTAGDQLKASQEQLSQRLQESSDFGKDVLGGFISDLRAGKSATEALAGAIEKVAEKLADIGLNALFDGIGGTPGGGSALLGTVGPFGLCAANDNNLDLRRAA
ncbi:hypothetical protein C9427_21400 [Mesorhizobium helmanticense]|uniref:Phage tail tape measure protein domain-containing protein n=2 Tax=Mesorhizobium helmanticense TaxID=1776423 RepID=A0A2T4IRE3_9HYPH|nr:hypothetical protein C9427_21400 [Mesorhizobium helmanticense]